MYKLSLVKLPNCSGLAICDENNEIVAILPGALEKQGKELFLSKLFVLAPKMLEIIEKVSQKEGKQVEKQLRQILEDIYNETILPERISAMDIKMPWSLKKEHAPVMIKYYESRCIVKTIEGKTLWKEQYYYQLTAKNESQMSKKMYEKRNSIVEDIRCQFEDNKIRIEQQNYEITFEEYSLLVNESRRTADGIVKYVRGIDPEISRFLDS